MENSVLIAGLAFVAIFGGSLAGIWLSTRLPQPHLTSESRTAISVSMAVVGTLSALVLSLLISNASTSFNTRTLATEGLAVDLVKLDHALARYGGEAVGARRLLQDYAFAKARELSAHDRRRDLGLDALHRLEQVDDAVLALHPADARGHNIQQRAMSLVDAITDARWTLAETAAPSIPHAVLAVLISWLTLLFASFGLFAPRNQTVVMAQLLCALAISGGIFMIMELGSPSSNLVRPSAEMVDLAVHQIGLPAGPGQSQRLKFMVTRRAPASTRRRAMQKLRTMRGAPSRSNAGSLKP